MRVLAEPLSDTSVNVTWEDVTIPGIVSYTVYYGSSDNMEQREHSVTVPSSDEIEDLMTNVEYQFQVAVIAEPED